MSWTWQEICDNPVVVELSYKIESDEWGYIIMSPPPGILHSDFQGDLIAWLLRLLPEGYAQPEYPLQTSQGVKGIDVVWVSLERSLQTPESATLPLLAPEICVEVLSPSNQLAEINRKLLLYFEQGALEGWICDGAGRMRFFDPAGPLERSRFCPDFPLQITRPRRQLRT